MYSGVVVFFDSGVSVCCSAFWGLGDSPVSDSAFSGSGSSAAVILFVRPGVFDVLFCVRISEIKI